MGDWWIDDDRYPGPGEYDFDFEAYFRGFIQFGRAVGRAWSSLSGDPVADLVEWEKRIIKAADKAPLIIPPEPTCTAETFTSLEEANDRLQKRLIGKGIVEGHGPRTATTYRRGRKQY